MTKNYLSRKERDNWLLAMTTTMYLDNIMDLWKNNLTSEEKRKLKTSITMTNNALVSIVNRMPEHEKDKLVKHAKNFEVKIMSVEGAKALEKRTFDEYNSIKMSDDDIKTLVTETITFRCNNCKMLCDKCDIYNIFLESLVPGLESQPNCPFAFETEEDIDNLKQSQSTKDFYKNLQFNKKTHEINKKIGTKKKISKRKQKKIANRYDE